MVDGKKPKPKAPDKADDKEQSERFIDTALTHDADDSKDAMDRAFKKIHQGRPAPRKGARSDGA